MSEGGAGMGGREELVAALAAVKELPDGDHKVTELERIVGGVDAAGDVRLGLAARFALIDAYQHHVERWRMLAAFDWCLAVHDRDPAMFDPWERELLRWYHKWAVAAVHGTHRVEIDRTTSLLDDLERRLRADGHSPQVVYHLRCRVADHVGDEAAARGWLVRWRAAPRDDNSDCAGCDPARQAELLAGWGEWEEAVRTVEPVLTGPPDCPEQPERALATVMVPLARLGRYEEAAQAHVRAYRRHRHERAAFPFLAEHLRFCALTGHHDRGLRLLTEHLGWLDRPNDEVSAMEFAAAGALVCRLAADAGLAARTIQRPAYGDRSAAQLAVSCLGADLLATTQDLAARFDARNGTGHQSERMAAWLAEKPLAEPFRGGPSHAPGGSVGGPVGGLGGVLLPVDDPPGDWARPTPVPADGRPHPMLPLTLEALIAVFTERGDSFVVEDGGVSGRWGDAYIHFERMGEHREILHGRIVAGRRLPAARLTDAYEFCNSWNHDRLMPKAYVHDAGDGELVLVGDVSTDLARGVAAPQLAVLVDAVLATGVTFAAAVAALP